jgi:hypothetical protein
LGRGRGFEVVSEHSLFDDENTWLLDLISDRVAVLYNLLFEDNGDDDDSEDKGGDDDDSEDDADLDDDGVNDGTADECEAGEENCELLDLVNDVLADIYEESFSSLGEAVEALVEAYLVK